MFANLLSFSYITFINHGHIFIIHNTLLCALVSFVVVDPLFHPTKDVLGTSQLNVNNSK